MQGVSLKFAATCQDQSGVALAVCLPLTADVVTAAWETLKAGSSAGKDGMPEFCQKFSEMFVPRMVSVLERGLA